MACRAKPVVTYTAEGCPGGVGEVEAEHVEPELVGAGPGLGRERGPRGRGRRIQLR
jgi:hypothetical protein